MGNRSGARRRQSRGNPTQTSEVEPVKLSVPTKWANFLIRLLSLRMGRYMIVLTIGEDGIDWSVNHVGKVER